MTVHEKNDSIASFDADVREPAYIFTSFATSDNVPAPLRKRRRIDKPLIVGDKQVNASALKFESLFNGLESLECVRLRQKLFTRHWKETEDRIQTVLGEANERTLAEVTTFVLDITQTENIVPAAFIVTGPNIASQSLLFSQLSERLKGEINGPVVTICSGDASNLKAALKQLIRDATNQKTTGDKKDEAWPSKQDGRKPLNYDLGILGEYVETHGTKKVVVAFQDSEAFESTLLAELISLFSSWQDRIPFVLLFGVATSVDMFHERLSRAASRCLYGAQFDVEQTDHILERVFENAIVGIRTPLLPGPMLVSSLVARQHDHVQSVQAFTTALKYAYMCHFYSNPLSCLNDSSRVPASLRELLQPEHYEAIRMLPSFQRLVDSLTRSLNTMSARELLENNDVLLREVEKALDSRDHQLTKLLRSMHLLSVASAGSIGKIDLYLELLKGTLSDSNLVRGLLDSVKKKSPEDLLEFVTKLQGAMSAGDLDLDLNGWLEEAQDSELLQEMMEIEKRTASLIDVNTGTGRSIRSSYTIYSKGLRTTVVAQKVQLSYEKSTLSKEDVEYTAVIDRLSDVLEQYLTFENPQDLFLNEIWLYDSLSPYRDVFTPRPRFAIERALSAPQDYLDSCNADEEALSSNKPATAILYQMYLESGMLVNVSDIWTAFFSVIGGEGGEGHDERTALMLFYRGLADLKLLGMVKQSRKKLDHLAKSTWKGL